MLDRSESCYWNKAPDQSCSYLCACCGDCGEYETLCSHCVLPRLCSDEELLSGGCGHFVEG